MAERGRVRKRTSEIEKSLRGSDKLVCQARFMNGKCQGLLSERQCARVQGLPSDWNTKIRESVLALALLRAGLRFDLKSVRRRPYLFARLGTIPCLAEALGVAGALSFAFSKLPLFAICCGFILAAPSPDSSFTDLSHAQEMGYGDSRGALTELCFGA